MKMLSTLARDTYVTDNGHYLVRPAGETWEVLNTVTDSVAATSGLRETAFDMALSFAAEAGR